MPKGLLGNQIYPSKAEERSPEFKSDDFTDSDYKFCIPLAP
jgi:hypothetical protein